MEENPGVVTSGFLVVTHCGDRPKANGCFRFAAGGANACGNQSRSDLASIFTVNFNLQRVVIHPDKELVWAATDLAILNVRLQTASAQVNENSIRFTTKRTKELCCIFHNGEAVF